MDEAEKLLFIWIKEKEMDGENIREGIISEMALRTYTDLLKETPSTSAEGESGITFIASRGRFEKHKHRSGIHGVVRHGEKYDGEFCDFVDTGGYLLGQVCNCDETGLFLEKYA